MDGEDREHSEVTDFNRVILEDALEKDIHGMIAKLIDQAKQTHRPVAIHVFTDSVHFQDAIRSPLKKLLPPRYHKAVDHFAERMDEIAMPIFNPENPRAPVRLALNIDDRPMIDPLTPNSPMAYAHGRLSKNDVRHGVSSASETWGVDPELEETEPGFLMIATLAFVDPTDRQEGLNKPDGNMWMYNDSELNEMAALRAEQMRRLMPAPGLRPSAIPPRFGGEEEAAAAEATEPEAEAEEAEAAENIGPRLAGLAAAETERRRGARGEQTGAGAEAGGAATQAAEDMRRRREETIENMRRGMERAVEEQRERDKKFFEEQRRSNEEVYRRGEEDERRRRERERQEREHREIEAMNGAAEAIARLEATLGLWHEREIDIARHPEAYGELAVVGGELAALMRFLETGLGGEYLRARAGADLQLAIDKLAELRYMQNEFATEANGEQQERLAGAMLHLQEVIGEALAAMQEQGAGAIAGRAAAVESAVAELNEALRDLGLQAFAEGGDTALDALNERAAATAEAQAGRTEDAEQAAEEAAQALNDAGQDAQAERLRQAVEVLARAGEVEATRAEAEEAAAPAAGASGTEEAAAEAVGASEAGAAETEQPEQPSQAESPAPIAEEARRRVEEEAARAIIEPVEAGREAEPEARGAEGPEAVVPGTEAPEIEEPQEPSEAASPAPAAEEFRRQIEEEAARAMIEPVGAGREAEPEARGAAPVAGAEPVPQPQPEAPLARAAETEQPEQPSQAEPPASIAEEARRRVEEEATRAIIEPVETRPAAGTEARAAAPMAGAEPEPGIEAPRRPTDTVTEGEETEIGVVPPAEGGETPAAAAPRTELPETDEAEDQQTGPRRAGDVADEAMRHTVMEGMARPVAEPEPAATPPVVSGPQAGGVETPKTEDTSLPPAPGSEERRADREELQQDLDLAELEHSETPQSPAAPPPATEDAEPSDAGQQGTGPAVASEAVKENVTHAALEGSAPPVQPEKQPPAAAAEPKAPAEVPPAAPETPPAAPQEAPPKTPEAPPPTPEAPPATPSEAPPAVPPGKEPEAVVEKAAEAAVRDDQAAEEASRTVKEREVVDETLIEQNRADQREPPAPTQQSHRQIPESREPKQPSETPDKGVGETVRRHVAQKIVEGALATPPAETPPETPPPAQKQSPEARQTPPAETPQAQQQPPTATTRRRQAAPVKRGAPKARAQSAPPRRARAAASSPEAKKAPVAKTARPATQNPLQQKRKSQQPPAPRSQRSAPRTTASTKTAVPRATNRQTTQRKRRAYAKLPKPEPGTGSE